MRRGEKTTNRSACRIGRAREDIRVVAHLGQEPRIEEDRAEAIADGIVVGARPVATGRRVTSSPGNGSPANAGVTAGSVANAIAPIRKAEIRTPSSPFSTQYNSSDATSFRRSCRSCFAAGALFLRQKDLRSRSGNDRGSPPFANVEFSVSRLKPGS